MVYTSDLRAKNLLKDVHVSVLEELKTWKLENKVFFRVFDDPSEDNRLWHDGGLTFKDPDTNLPLGSNDGAWYIKQGEKEVPLVVVEGTFGTERGQFGDGQLNRFSHPLAVAKLGYVGVLLTPYRGESYVKGNGCSECNKSFASMKYAYVRKIIVKAALSVCEIERGLYLVMGAYEPDLLKRLVIEAAKAKFELSNSFDKVVEEVKFKMKNFVGPYRFEDRSLQLLNRVFDKDGQLIPDAIGRIYTHNYEALTTATKRDGHGLLGKNLAQPYLSAGKTIYSVFIRLTEGDLRKLSKRHSKEFTYILHGPSSQIVCLDDLIFLDRGLEKRVRAILRQNLHKNPEKELIAEVRNAIENNAIRINLKSLPEKLGQPRQLTLEETISH